ncbi:secretory phospholipase A2 receptor-like [Seriola lalandi dorsalis]|uniref:secretory phospholipase A2 receptor-like n=1 Tax=Seriola lalandi dorsalis TaxID=1841481 RepID=UPI000C6F6B8A|nr:secretory phospholipase A2 receptor-like [Seriola lalandi dorsalis]
MMMMMKSDLSRPSFLLLVLCSSASGLGSVVLRYYLYIRHYYTWEQARSYCRSSGFKGDLAVIYTQSDVNNINLHQYHAWHGLHLPSSSSSWAWSGGPANSHITWGRDEPQRGDECAYVSYTKRWFYGSNCGVYYFFFCDTIQANNYKYIFIPQSKTWSEAQQFCRSKYRDLATLRNTEAMSKAIVPRDFPVWTGLRRDGGTWKWTKGSSEYRNWASNEPSNNGDCVSIFSLRKEMATQNCSARFPFICYRDNLVLVKESKTWEEALEHCRALSTPTTYNRRYELVSVQPGEDHDFVMNKVMQADTEEVWTGLRFLAGHWLWINGADMLYPDLPVCPLMKQHCGTLSKNSTGNMETRDCEERKNFLCYSK